jgi:uncharacterized protein YdcH (DUF465 family)
VYLSEDNAVTSKEVDKKIKEIERDMNTIKTEYKDLWTKRKLDFKDENYNNIVYKMLEKYNLLNKMLKVKKLLSDGFQTQDIHDYAEKLKITKNISYYKTIIESLKQRYNLQ